MRLSRRSLGQQYPGQGITAPSCGDNPCAWYDYLYVTDDCEEWLQCAGQPAVTFSSVLGQGVQSIASGAASVVGAGLSGATSNVGTDIFLGILVVAGIGIWLVLEKV